MISFKKLFLLSVKALLVIVVIGSVSRLLIPALQDLPDEKRKQQAMEEMRLILAALNNYSEDNNHYPAKLVELEKKYLSLADYGDRYWYVLRSRTNRCPILIEKPGHYRRISGGFIAYPPGIVRFMFNEDYENYLDVYIYETSEDAILEGGW